MPAILTSSMSLEVCGISVLSNERYCGVVSICTDSLLHLLGFSPVEHPLEPRIYGILKVFKMTEFKVMRIKL